MLRHLCALDSLSSSGRLYHRCGRPSIPVPLSSGPRDESTSNLVACNSHLAGTFPLRDHHPLHDLADEQRNSPVACTCVQICRWCCSDPHRSHVLLDVCLCTASFCRLCHTYIGFRSCPPKETAFPLYLRARRLCWALQGSGTSLHLVAPPRAAGLGVE